MDKNFKLTPDQFQIDDEGHLFINQDEISEGLRRQEPAELSNPEEGVFVGIGVSINMV